MPKLNILSYGRLYEKIYIFKTFLSERERGSFLCKMTYSNNVRQICAWETGGKPDNPRGNQKFLEKSLAVLIIKVHAKR